MPGPTLTAHELAEELGRSAQWVYDNWRAQVEAKRLPRPLLGGERPLTWSAAQVYAIIDQSLTREQRIAASAFRAAAAAAAGAPKTYASAGAVEAWKEKLEAQFSPAHRPAPGASPEESLT